MRLVKIMLFGLFSAGISAFSADLTWRNPSCGPFLWREISQTRDAIYLPSTGAVLKSKDGRDWTLHYQPTQSGLLSIAQSPDKLLAVGAAPDPADSAGSYSIFISTNGTDFNFLKKAPSPVYQIAYGNGRFVASAFELMYSDDGLIWHRTSQVPSNIVYPMGDLIFAGGKFLQATHSGVYVSDDGVNWSQSGAEGGLIDYWNGIYVVLGNNVENNRISFSNDARTWRTQAFASPEYPTVMAIGTPGIVVVGYSPGSGPPFGSFSADYTNWVRFTLPFINRPGDLKYANGQYLMIGYAGLIAQSSDGTNWTSNISVPPVRMMAAVKGGDRVIGAGFDLNYDGTGLWSSNGVAWHPLDLKADWYLTDIAYQNGAFVAVGLNGQIVVSTNAGEQWIKIPPLTNANLGGVTATPRGFIATGQRAMLLSTNGLEWDFLPLGSYSNYAFSPVAFGNDVYVVAGSDEFLRPAVFVSKDLKDWTVIRQQYGRIKFGNGRFVAEGGYVSTDGINWVRVNAPPRLLQLSFSDGWFCAVTGGENWYDQTHGYVSVDGLHWHHVYDLAALGIMPQYRFGRLLAMATFGVAEIDNFGFLDVNQNSDGSIGLQRIHPANMESQIESSTDFMSWSEVDQPLPVPLPSNENQFFRLKLEVFQK
jgi:hypothetical protein